MTSPTTCAPICGDGITVGTENCDNGVKNKKLGCNEDCIGNSTGFNCSLTFNNTKKTACDFLCRDGIVVKGEKCDAGIDAGTTGCNARCTGSMPGWNCTGGDYVTPSNCSLIGGLQGAGAVA
jgi:large repetitive protein